jgi:hypothetical protein
LQQRCGLVADDPVLDWWAHKQAEYELRGPSALPLGLRKHSHELTPDSFGPGGGGNEVLAGKGIEKIVWQDGRRVSETQQRFQRLIFLVKLASGCEPEPLSRPFQQSEGRPPGFQLGVGFLVEAQAPRLWPKAEALMRGDRKSLPQGQHFWLRFIRGIEEEGKWFKTLDGMNRFLTQFDFDLNYYGLDSSFFLTLDAQQSDERQLASDQRCKLARLWYGQS